MEWLLCDRRESTSSESSSGFWWSTWSSSSTDNVRELDCEDTPDKMPGINELVDEVDERESREEDELEAEGPLTVMIQGSSTSLSPRRKVSSLQVLRKTF